VICWNGDNIYYKPGKEDDMNLDEIPSIYLDKILEENLFEERQAFLETQRGCRFKCKYCVYHKNLNKIKYYSLERVFNELDYLILKKQITALRILDAIFSSDVPRAKEILKHLIHIKKVAKLPWIYLEFTPYNIDEEFIQLISFLKNKEQINNSNELTPLGRPQFYSEMLRDYTVINCIGIQSFNEKSLKAISRPIVSNELLEKFMGIVKKYNLVLKIDLILGLPHETFESYFKGIEYFLPYFKNTDHVLNIHRLQILPGSELENLCDKFNIVYSKEAPHLVFSTNSLSKDEFNRASKLTAILFRILNSPLRKYFFDYKEKTGKDFIEIINEIYEKITSSDIFKDTAFTKKEQVDDIYWNKAIFKEIPSEWLKSIIKLQ
jgi:hypothetical protein